MMKKFIFAVLGALVFSMYSVYADDDTQVYRYDGLDSLLTQFYVALEPESIDVKNREFDGLISTCTDSLTRQHVTLRVLNHYMHARVMGEEAVAIHIFDEWLKSGKVEATSEFEYMEAEMFANCNRRSLIGMTAEKIDLLKPSGRKMTIPEDGKIAVLFFYDTSCAKCRLETMVLPEVLSEVDFPMNFYAVYVSDNKRDWKAFRRNFKIKNKNVRMVHLWDPEMDSGYHLAYGVTGTPRMFVVWSDGEIIGRRLEVENLKEIINYIKIANEEE
ncbi:MAG TPA: hypothetical protein DDX33_01080 [Rikenellaceae bacterium]|nr:hypothetical protein [Rikenellaceae bacterium]